VRGGLKVKTMDTARKKPRKPLPPSPDFVTIREVAIYCCVDESTVSRKVKKGDWPFVLLRRTWIGKRVLFTRASFNHMARAMKRSVEATPSDVVPIEEGRLRSA
jgi:hypothetical protein